MNSSSSENKKSKNGRYVINKDLNNEPINWLKQNSALLIIHGIGNQRPLETLDHFGRSLVAMLQQAGHELSLEHRTTKKKGATESIWFENYIRIKKVDSENYIDLFEYYWADVTEDQASISDSRTWLNKVASGANKFYKDNKEIGLRLGDKSIFFDSKGNFNGLTYKFFLMVTISIIPLLSGIWSLILKALHYIPIIGNLISNVLDNFLNTQISQARNVANDVVIYNSTDAKSRFNKMRRKILGGSVQSLRYLLEQREGDQFPPYEKVVVAGHSLVHKLLLILSTG